MDAEIALPTRVPPNVRLDVGTSVSVYTDNGVRSAQVKLDTQQGDVWGIMYGRSGLDGCDGERHARSPRGVLASLLFLAAASGRGPG
jgi:hypothetical protein